MPDKLKVAFMGRKPSPKNYINVTPLKTMNATRVGERSGT